MIIIHYSRHYLFGRLFLFKLGEDLFVLSSLASVQISPNVSSTSFMPFRDFRFIEKYAKSDWTNLETMIENENDLGDV